MTVNALDDLASSAVLEAAELLLVLAAAVLATLLLAAAAHELLAWVKRMRRPGQQPAEGKALPHWRR